MKVQSWPTLLATVFWGGAMLVLEIKEVIEGNTAAVIMIAFWGYIIIRGLYVSFSKEGYEKDKRQAAKGKRIYRAKFGIFAPIMPYLTIIIILLDYLLISIFPVTTMLKIIAGMLLVVAVGYAFWLSAWFRKQMEQEDYIEFLKHISGETSDGEENFGPESGKSKGRI